MEWLQWADQEKIRVRIKAIQDEGTSPPISGSTENNENTSPKSAMPKVEHAKAGSGKCFKCKDKIGKGEMRIAYKASNYHPHCFKNLEVYQNGAEKVSGFEALNDEDKKAIQELLGKAAEKRAASEENGDGPPKKQKKAETEEDTPEMKQKLKEQSETLWEVRNQFLDNLSAQEMEALLESNGRHKTKGGIDPLLDQLVDCVVFGVPVKCSTCKKGILLFNSSGRTYQCSGNISEYTSCTFSIRNPERKLFKITKKMKEENEFLGTYKIPQMQERMYSAAMLKEVPVENIKLGPSTSGASKTQKSEPKVQKVLVKNGCTVDPSAEDSENLHVYIDKVEKFPWQATLGSADVLSNKNSFYKLQLLENDNKEIYYLFRSWGRVGTSIGGSKTESYFSNLDAAKVDFKKQFYDKTLNEWDNRKKFKKHPNGFAILEMDFDAKDDGKLQKLDVKSSKSNLAMPIKELLSTIFDIKRMTRALQEMEIDTDLYHAIEPKFFLLFLKCYAHKKNIQLFASLLSSDIEPRVEITQKEEGEEEKEEENSVNDRKSPAEKSLKLIVKENSGFALGTDRLSFDFAVPIEFHAEEFFGERSDPRYFGVNSEDLAENDFEEAMNSTGDSQGVVRRAPPPPAKPKLNIHQQRFIHSSGIPPPPNSTAIGTGGHTAISATPVDPLASSSTCRGPSSSVQAGAAQSPASSPFTPSSSSVVSETVQVRSAGQCIDRISGEEVALRTRPQVPPKPQIDLVRYSMANVKEELDLDTILGELLELENQLSSREGADQLFLGLPTLPTSTSHSSQLNQAATSTRKVQSNGSLTDDFPPPRVQTEFCISPDADSAYGDSSSTECSSGDTNRYRNSEISSADSYRGSLNTPSPQQASPKSVSAISVAGSQSACTSESTTTYNATQPNIQQHQLSSSDVKAAKIREALEKMKEAKIKKIYVKFFLHDGSTQGLLIDERWTVLDTMKKLTEKLNITLTAEHSIIEEYPELHF
uniref:NAD(+) ADP-ribosyltransferase n=1 Tax=Acrobeloides nanus TaxID=290746 RepID=A0A914CBF8_9BILA